MSAVKVVAPTPRPAIRVTLLRSRFGRSPGQTHALRCVGLRKIRQWRVMEASPALLGNIKKVREELFGPMFLRLGEPWATLHD
jgi:ribosomal protein L30/L7E